jgi:hypothetical protein
MEGLDENDQVALSDPFLKKEEIVKKENGNNKTSASR